MTFDFSGLQGGVLPAGSIIAFLDVDNYEYVVELSGFAQGGLQGQYFNPWLTQFNGTGTPPAAFDYENPDGGVTQGQAAAVTQNSGFYSLNGDPSNQDLAFQGFTTSVPLGSLSFIYGISDQLGTRTRPSIRTASRFKPCRSRRRSRSLCSAVASSLWPRRDAACARPSLRPRLCILVSLSLQRRPKNPEGIRNHEIQIPPHLPYRIRVRFLDESRSVQLGELESIPTPRPRTPVLRVEL